MTDFEVWLSAAELDEYEDIYSLYKSVKEADSFGPFTVKQAKGAADRWILTASHIDGSLILASPIAREAFLRLIKDRYCDGEDIEGWYGFQYAMSKED